LDNRKCAVGWLIRDEDYDPECEGDSPDLIMDMGLLSPHLEGQEDETLSRHSKEQIRIAKSDFLEHLQICHDDSRSPKEMEKRLQAVASMFDLEIPTD
jgi:hypothetical protein